MLDLPIEKDAATSGGPQFRLQVVLEASVTGIFRCAISSVIGKGNWREVTIEAGKSHKFTIREDELPQ